MTRFAINPASSQKSAAQVHRQLPASRPDAVSSPVAAHDESPLRDARTIADAVEQAMGQQPITDIHTHLYPPAFGTPSRGSNGRHDQKGLMLWGIDEMLTYHYLVAEVFRVVPSSTLPYEEFWRMSKSHQADHVWRHLFMERSPVSEACRGLVTTLHRLGLDPAEKNLSRYRQWYAEQDADEFVDLVMQKAGIESITMTNNVFDDNERQRWLGDASVGNDSRFKAVVRIDPLVCEWPSAAAKLCEWGYEVSADCTASDAESARRFVRDWIERTNAIYVAASLPPEFRYPDGGAGQWVLEQVILPVCRERGMPLALMIGARRAVNPALRDGGDGSAAADVSALLNLCAAFPQNKLLVTLLSRENQHELAVAARKFDNLMIFGCWWFLNTPSLIEEITRMRVELLGLSFIPQHSDARVLDQLVYKWDHSRRVLAKVLTDKYVDLAEAAWPVTTSAIRQDVYRLLQGNFQDFLDR